MLFQVILSKKILSYIKYDIFWKIYQVEEEKKEAQKLFNYKIRFLF